MSARIQVEIKAIYSGHADAIYDLLPGLMEPYFYSASGDSFIACWNKATGTFEQPIAKATSSVYCMELLADKGLLLIGTRSGDIHVVDILQRKALHTFHYHNKSVFDLQYLPEQSCWLSAGENGQLVVWNLNDFSVLKSLDLADSSIRCMSVSPDQQSLVVGGSDNLVRLFSLPNFEQTQVLNGHDNSVFTAAFRNNDTLLTGGRDAQLLVWKKVSNTWEMTEKLPAHNFTINHIAFNQSSQLMATASRDKTVKIWDASNMQLLKVLDIAKYPSAHSHSVNRLLWLNEKLLLSAGDDKRIIAWDINKI